MEINATLLVQLVHFLIVYIIIDHIILRLATSIVRAEDRKLGLLEGDTLEHEKRIASRIRYNEDDWLILQKRLQSECPAVQVGRHVQAPYENLLSYPPPSQENIQALSEPLKNMLVATIMNGKEGHD